MLRSVTHSNGTIYKAYPRKLWKRHVYFTEVNRTIFVCSVPVAVAIDLIFLRAQGLPFFELIWGGLPMFAASCALEKYSALGDQVPVTPPKDLADEENKDEIVWIASAIKEKQ